jgi:predicted DNA-binding transcriptional regulator AlpA
MSTRARILSFTDLQELDLVRCWPTLNRWIEKQGFPPGHIVGRRRLWLEDDVLAWIRSRPTENNQPLRGCAKRLAEAAA